MKDLSGTPVLVTGGTGFVGSHLVRRLAAAGASLTLAVRSDSKTWRIDDLAPGVKLVGTNLIEPEAAVRLVRASAPQLVFHLAGDISGRGAADDVGAWYRSIQVNTVGTLNLLAAIERHALETSRIIRVGGMEEYGNGPVPFVETQREQVVSPYSAGQVAATQISHALARSWGLPLVTLRPSIIYGPAQDPGFFIPGLISACLEGRDFAMTDGNQRSDFVYVDDVVDALLRAAQADDIEGEIFNVGSGTEISVRDLADRIVRQSGASIDLEVGAVPARAGEATHRMLDIAKADDALDWRPSTTIESGIEQTIAWFRGNRPTE